MGWKTRWSGAQRDRARSEDKGLFILGVDNKFGRFEVAGLMGHDASSFLLRFAQELYLGRSPGDALAAVQSGADGAGEAAALARRESPEVAAVVPWGPGEGAR
jgi:hypothetical protein